MSKPIEIVMNDELEKLLAAATPGPWTHASDKLAAGNIKAPDNAALIVAERLREESAANRRLLRLYAIQHGTVTET
jgi:hypothetical protein